MTNATADAIEELVEAAGQLQTTEPESSPRPKRSSDAVIQLAILDEDALTVECIDAVITLLVQMREDHLKGWFQACRPGTRIRLNQNMVPASMRGCEGVVVGVHRYFVLVNIDHCDENWQGVGIHHSNIDIIG